ncbi:MAG: AraC family transcriptional regulator [Herbinix sp.]|nr:AraC family transcriptional regulator [Herbinix sp.]
MNDQSNSPLKSVDLKDFWDSLQIDILTSNQQLASEDCLAFIERSFMFSMLFRGCLPFELAIFQQICNIKDFACLILIELPDLKAGSSTDELELHHMIKNSLPTTGCSVGPLVTNRMSLLISYDSAIPEKVHKEESIALCKELVEIIESNYDLSVKIGIGSVKSIHSIYSSFLDALACMYFNIPNHITHYLDLRQLSIENRFDYLDTEKHLIEAIRLRKPEAYDYFGIIMEWIDPLNDDIKRNKILEILVMANHTMQMDSKTEAKFINYTSYVSQFMELRGSQLTEFAFQCFIYITSYVKPQSTIDYTNHIVKATREYLENHYTDDISLEDMASQVNISPQYFSKLIKKTTGFNFIDWLSMLRVKKAKELLTDTSLTVKEVCFMVGYKDPNYFSRIFKKRIGLTPSEYVKANSYLNNKS